jgi:hypothetical protein
LVDVRVLARAHKIQDYKVSLAMQELDAKLDLHSTFLGDLDRYAAAHHITRSGLLARAAGHYIHEQEGEIAQP